MKNHRNTISHRYKQTHEKQCYAILNSLLQYLCYKCSTCFKGFLRSWKCRLLFYCKYSLQNRSVYQNGTLCFLLVFSEIKMLHFARQRLSAFTAQINCCFEVQDYFLGNSKSLLLPLSLSLISCLPACFGNFQSWHSSYLC